MTTTPKSLRLHIAFFGRRNVGKSSLLNALTRQQVSIVSPVAGTTTDPVEKPMELLPLGPVLFIDTAGIDDTGELGALRVQKTRQVLERTDLAVLVAEAGTWGNFESEILAELTARKTPTVVVFNKIDLAHAGDASSPNRGCDALVAALLQKHQLIISNPATKASPSPACYGASQLPLRVVKTSAAQGIAISELRQALLDAAPPDFIDSPAILGDLVGPGELAVLVVPIDKEAPKGRLILPQVQSIRDLLDSDAYCLVVKERELRSALNRLKTPPKLVVTDSQAFLKVAADTPRSVPMTSFSILMSRFKGDLLAQVQGALAIENLRGGDRVLIAEACSHHPIGEDIGRVKIPRWLTQYTGAKIHFEHMQGRDFPADLADYKLVIHCGACMWNRREMLSRILRCQQAGVPITNYGLTIAYSLGIFERALQPFPAALEFFRNANVINTGLQPGAGDAQKTKPFQRLCPPCEMPLKRLKTPVAKATGLKSGANESNTAATID
jgi:[FeFe] hydrogenase H-cluster maturation GTPase HydF